MQQRCPNCGSPVAPGQRFCGVCGSQMSLSCPYCRIAVSPGTRFCPNCGASLGGGQPQQPGWGQQPGGMPQQPGGMPQQPGWGQQPGGMPQQPAWGQQPAWAPPAPRPRSSSRPLLVLVLFILLIGLGALVFMYTPVGDTIKDLFTSGGGTTTTTTDTKKPVISDVEVTAGPTSARIDWKTSENASSQVEYGKTETYGELEPAQPQNDPTSLDAQGKPTSAGVVTHAVILSGLEPETTYHYRVKSKDKAGNIGVSEDKTFTTTEAEE